MRIMTLYLEGKTQWEIVDDPDIDLKTQSSVSRRLAKIREHWRQSAIWDMDEMMGRELDRIDKVETEAWRAWFLSFEAAEVHVESASETTPYQVVNDAGQPVVGEDGETIIHPGTMRRDVRDEVRGRLPDPRYLQVIAWATEQRMKIFGLVGADMRSGNAGEPFQIEVFHRLVAKAERGELIPFAQPNALKVVE